VHDNDGWRLDPRVTLATALHAAGYHTLIAGKYLNGLDRIRDKTPPGWDHAALDSGGYFHYAAWVDGRREIHGGGSSDYSTDVFARRSLAWLRAAPRDRPRFALLTPYATHGDPAAGTRLPTPAPRHRGDRRCADIGFRRTPAWNEASMADRAAWVRRLTDITRLPGIDDRGWPLRRACESLLSVDEWMAGVIAIQRNDGRLGRTLFVLLGDNGMSWGDHRHFGKDVSWTTPIPLYVHWSDGLGTASASNPTPVQGLDLAPTFVELAGGRLAGYPSGQARPDGHSIIASLLAGEPTGALVQAEYEEHRSHWPHLRWTAMRTTAAHPCGLWHYTEWVDGDVELFDADTDPWELRNVARSRPLLVRRLHAELRGLRAGRQPSGTTC
jgi:arylsulfatase A-like enzyme